MTLKDILEKSAIILGIDDVDFENPSKKVNKLIDAGKMIISELTLEIFPLKTKETVSIEGGKCYYQALSKPVRQVLKVKRGEEILPFETLPERVQLSPSVSGVVEVTYLYYLPDVTLQEELPLPPSFSAYVLSSGVVSEYYFREGMVDEATFYKTRYDYSVLNVTRNLKSSYVIPKRGFIW